MVDRAYLRDINITSVGKQLTILRCIQELLGKVTYNSFVVTPFKTFLSLNITIHSTFLKRLLSLYLTLLQCNTFYNEDRK